MPFVWAKKTSLFGEVKFGNMFYPEGIQLSRKEKLGLIWCLLLCDAGGSLGLLAANYDPDKNRKLIPASDCEGTNIVQICAAIINPVHPHALRLSAQLLLGTVRVYRTKARLALKLAEQVMLNLSSLLKEASTRNIDLAVVSVARTEAITMANGVISIVDYSLEPVYYDPQMIMHMNEDDLILVNGSTPFSSPIKIEKHKPTPVTPQKSPLVVSNRQISISEDLLSPNRPIVIPGEEDFGPNQFGPAQDGFLEDLNLQDGFLETGDLPPVFEEDEGEKQPMPTKRKLADFMIDELSVNNDSEVDLDQILQDVMSINFPSVDSPVHEGNEMQEQPEQRNRYQQTQQEKGREPQDSERGTLLPDRSKQKTLLPETTAVGEPMEWEQFLVTPADAIVLNPLPQQPKKKRKLQVDKVKILQSDEIRSNLAKPEDLVRAPISAGTVLPGAKELFDRPIVGDITTKLRTRTFWKANKKVVRNRPPSETINLPLSTTDTDDEFEKAQKSPEIVRKADDTPSSIDILRTGSTSFRSIEQSGGSTKLISRTPQDDALSQGSFDQLVDFNVNDHFSDYNPTSPRVSSIGTLPDIVEVNLSDVPELEAIQEEADRTLTQDNQVEPQQQQSETEQEEEEMFFTVGDDDENFPKNLIKYRTRLLSSMKTTSDHVTFQQLFPAPTTKRRDAVLAFYTCLNLNKNNFIWLEQSDAFGPILISRKHVGK